MSSCNFTDFKKMTTGYSGYCEIIKKYSEYGNSSISNDIKFEYITNDSLLEQLKSQTRFPQDLDSLSEIEKIIKLKTWLNQTLKYEYGYSGDNSRTISKPRNLIRMLELKDDINTVFVCRDFGIALTELYLSVGLQARYVTCMSVFTNDKDSHVVTEVFWKKKNKWIMMDASFNSYIMNENKELLGLQEIRNCFEEKKTLIVSENIKIVKPAYYLKYMAKNSFKFMRPLVSEFNVENSNCRHILLLPLNYDEQDYINSDFVITMNDSEHFWR